MATALYNIFIMPLQMFIELVFSIINLVFNNVGISILGVSVAVQLLCFPLYKRADDIQAQDREKQKEMKPWLDHIKKTFKGDERFMMQQTYYRSADYKPIYAIKGSISLLLQIPFFIAAYNYLSNLPLLKGTSFLGIADLSQPDQLIHIGGISINLLPVLMTFFNIISGIIYLRGLPLKDKIQTYGLAAIFLVILYRSPAGLVFYWTLNNLFSLLKNVFLKLVKQPRKVLKNLCAIGSLVMLVLFFILNGKISVLKRILILCVALLGILPSVFTYVFKNRRKTVKSEVVADKNSKIIFYLCSALLTVLVGLMIPSSTVATSPTEFGSVNYDPLGLVFQTFCTVLGIFMVWINIFYIFLNNVFKKIITYSTAILSTAGLITFLFFNKKLGLMSPIFYYSTYPEFSLLKKAANLLIFLVLFVLIFILLKKKSVFLKRIYQVLILTVSISAVFNCVSIAKNLADTNYKEVNELSDNYEQIIPVSKTGKNVVVLMLDRAISGYVPYIFNEKPELKKQFDGFTYYPNSISFGYSTNYGAPALFGGYEYTPTEMNKRADETLESKHNEALSVLPVLFADNNYKVTVLDPPYLGYQMPSDLSVYEQYSGINASLIEHRYLGKIDPEIIKYNEDKQKHNFVYYSFMKVMPVIIHNVVYDGGNYFSTDSQVNYEEDFLGGYAVLDGLSELTKIEKSNENTFLMMQNITTHQPSLLTENDYSLDVTLNDYFPRTKTDVNGKTLVLSDHTQLTHYDVNMLSMIKIGEWLDYLKENDVYDNTKIIIVSDHGLILNQFEEAQMDINVSVENCRALLMVKDFNSTGFKTSDEFMTNADTPTLAVSGVVKNPVNPFTGNTINSSEKTLHPQVITTSNNNLLKNNHGNTFDTADGEWWSVKDNIFDVKNWQKAEVN